ncbi:GNAT family N-acetyltransferase [Streptococcus saliviloxodontae]|uniref:Ribosomal protein S18 acetylase RimI-like enzyme n=1 Tax=Streptococcus saliviloxodontae TaxID=1349416 RepID=A0ABS2PNY2_9STRE|nr:GNAT family N-acetyltransferase [Streptococcus saliviloxodontae]MBM7636666.1 ribosomal protein S18 acetylase RimI-like enzyme [Streptococcus saliviloxodontae]
MKIRLALEDELPLVRAFYHSMIDQLQDSPYFLGWEKEVYPTTAYLEESVGKEQLYLGILEDEIVSAMVVNHDCNEGYAKYDWEIEAEPQEVSIIHILGVSPKHAGKGYAKQMLETVFDKAREDQQKAIRLDVLAGNTPAEKLYQRMGFQYKETVQMYYEDTGLTDFHLYEYPL